MIGNLIYPGDLFFWRGRSPFANVVRWRTASTYSHVALAVPLYDGRQTPWYCLEAVPLAGVRLYPVARYLREKPEEQIDLFRLDVTGPERWKVVRLALAEVGDGYALLSQFAWSVGWLGSWLRRLCGGRGDLHIGRQFCSELVAGAFQGAGLALPKEPALMTPQDVAELPYVSFVEPLRLSNA